MGGSGILSCYPQKMQNGGFMALYANFGELIDDVKKYMDRDETSITNKPASNPLT